MINVLIIGKKSFLGSNLQIYLSRFFKTDNFSYEEIFKKKKFFFDKYSHIINTSIHPNYIKHKYNKNFDLDKKFIEKFDKIKFYYIFLNTRKIYSPKYNITEKSTIHPHDNYAKNKFATEKYLKLKLKRKLLSLRISNVIGKRIFKNNRNTHKLFYDNFIDYNKNKNKKIIVSNDFKDFLSIDQFCKIIFKVIKLKINGVFNVSISEKIFVSEIVKWLDRKALNKIQLTKSSSNSFTLSNYKLLNKIKIKITKNQLKKFCKKKLN